MKGYAKRMRVSAFSIMLMLALLLTACGGTAVPSAAADYVGRDHGLVRSELERAGFKNIEEEAVPDLTSEQIREDGTVESITINNSADFAAAQKFSASAKILIRYHMLPKIVFPLTAEETGMLTAGELAAKLTEAGYTNVESEVLYDLDPDKTDAPFENEIKIDGKKIPREGEEIPFDAAIKVTGHYPYEKYDVKLYVDYEANILFGKYVIDITVDGEKVAELKNGGEGTFDLRLKEGEHALVFAKTGDPSVKGETTFTVEESCEVSYWLKSHTNYIDVNEKDAGEESEVTPTETPTETPTPTEEPTPTETPTPTEEPTETPAPTETPEPAATEEPETSVYEYAFIRRLTGQNLYYLFDMDSKTARYFGNQDKSVSTEPFTGELASGVTLTIDNGDGTEGYWKFMYSGAGKKAVVTDHLGFEYEYELADVSEAEEVLYNYCGFEEDLKD